MLKCICKVKIKMTNYLAPQEIAHDPRSAMEKLSAETLLYKINHPSTESQVFFGAVPKPIRSFINTEPVSVGQGAIHAIEDTSFIKAA